MMDEQEHNSALIDDQDYYAFTCLLSKGDSNDIACFNEGISLPHQYTLHVVGFCGGGRALRLRLRLRLPATKEAGVVLDVDHDDLDGGDDDGEQRDEDDHDAHA